MLRSAGALVLTASTLVAAPAWSLDRPGLGDAKGFVLRDGVVVDAGRALVYAMLPAGGLAAIDVETGSRAWTSDEAGRPLALADGILLAQRDGAAGDDALVVVGLRVDERGRVDFSAEVPVGAPLDASIDEGLGRSLRVTAEVVSGRSAVVAWELAERVIRGANLAPADGPVEESVRVGASLVDWSAGEGAVTELSPQGFVAPVPIRLATESEVVSGVAGPQYVSADGAYRHTSRHLGTPDLAAWRWTLYSSAGDAVTDFDAIPATAPFAVVGAVVLVESPPASFREGELLRDHPLALIARDLSSGRERWRTEIRDTRYTGPFPP